ncbi:hypothetical protein, partial [Treponema pedis]|uniref:hypothetical protein n=1 Tax=Treponema pedis TaxID=409322 RepID=UPI00056EA59B
FIGRLILNNADSIVKNAVEFAFRQTSCIVCRFSLRPETAEILQSSNLKILAVAEFIGRLILNNADSIV